ncbi:membrane protein [Vibrio cholerae O1 biovar El Tor str. L-3226]|nr:membrane protein [Vibrio cholerae O1 biovar El Tor str. L-3226]
MLCLSFVVMRCQPLRRALGAFLLMLDQSLRTTSCND